MHRIAAQTELKKGLGIFKERGIEKSKSFERRKGFVEKLLPIAQKMVCFQNTGLLKEANFLIKKFL